MVTFRTVGWDNNKPPGTFKNKMIDGFLINKPLPLPPSKMEAIVTSGSNSKKLVLMEQQTLVHSPRVPSGDAISFLSTRS